VTSDKLSSAAFGLTLIVEDGHGKRQVIGENGGSGRIKPVSPNVLAKTAPGHERWFISL
jgi:hypothetical protein